MVQQVLTMNVNSDRLFFGDTGHGISRYDVVRYPILTKVNDKMRGFYWNPKEVDVGAEKRSFDKMTDAEQFVFTSNLKRQILLDSIQGRAPALAFLPHCTDSTLENCLLTWSFFESIHSESYTHIIKAIYPDPKIIVDDMPNIRQIVDCAADVTASYDNLISNPNKENLYLGLIAANALEAIRFYVSFACSFSFLERGIVEGSAKVIKLIARDENQHLALVQHILKLLPQDDPDFIQIIGDNRQKATDIFMSAANQEKEWAKYLFQHGSILGLNTDILCSYVDDITSQRLKAVGLPHDQRPTKTLPWMDKHLTSENSQVAPQEVELSSYLAASIKNDLSSANFSDVWLPSNKIQKFN